MILLWMLLHYDFVEKSYFHQVIILIDVISFILILYSWYQSILEKFLWVVSELSVVALRVSQVKVG